MPARPGSGTVCVLGGTGFVGRVLASRLIRLGYEVRVPTRNRERARRMLVLPGVQLLDADVHDAHTLKRLLRGCTAAINLVGILNERGHDGSGFRVAHLELTEKLVAACQDAGVNRLLQMSALKANAERGPSHYLRTKGQAELAIRNAAGEDLRYTIFRPSVIFGPEDSFINRFAGLLKLMPIFPLARADARFAPVFVEDVVEAFAGSLADPATYGQTYQLCGPEIYSLGEIVAWIRRELGLRRVVIHLPDPLGRLQALTADYLLPGKPFSLDNFRSLTVASVCTEDGFEPLGIKPRSMKSIVPQYLGRRSVQDPMARLRKTAGR
jgi:uncharacterized protein YbjT (DUF2867 family)